MIRDIHVPEQGYSTAPEAMKYVEEFKKLNPNSVVVESWPVRRTNGYHPVIIYYHD